MALTDNLVEFWTLNGTLTGINGNTLVSPDGLEHYVPGVIGQAWDVANVATRILRQLPCQINPGDSDWSWSAWLWIEDIESPDTGFLWSLYDSTTLKSLVALEPTNEITVLHGPSFPSGETQQNLAWSSGMVHGWNHLVVTSDVDGRLRGYLNNVLDDASGDCEGGPIPTCAAPNLYVGGNRLTSAYASPIDCFGFWSRVLTEPEISDLYAAGAGWEPSVASVVTNILWGSTPDQSRILNSRIVRGML
jgi:hypothetical protein